MMPYCSGCFQRLNWPGFYGLIDALDASGESVWSSRLLGLQLINY